MQRPQSFGSFLPPKPRQPPRQPLEQELEPQASVAQPYGTAVAARIFAHVGLGDVGSVWQHVTTLHQGRGQCHSSARASPAHCGNARVFVQSSQSSRESARISCAHMCARQGRGSRATPRDRILEALESTGKGSGGGLSGSQSREAAEVPLGRRHF